MIDRLAKNLLQVNVELPILPIWWKRIKKTRHLVMHFKSVDSVPPALTPTRREFVLPVMMQCTSLLNAKVRHYLKAKTAIIIYYCCSHQYLFVSYIYIIPPPTYSQYPADKGAVEKKTKNMKAAVQAVAFCSNRRVLLVGDAEGYIHVLLASGSVLFSQRLSTQHGILNISIVQKVSFSITPCCKFPLDIPFCKSSLAAHPVFSPPAESLIKHAHILRFVCLLAQNSSEDVVVALTTGGDIFVFTRFISSQLSATSSSKTKAQFRSRLRTAVVRNAVKDPSSLATRWNGTHVCIATCSDSDSDEAIAFWEVHGNAQKIEVQKQDTMSRRLIGGHPRKLLWHRAGSWFALLLKAGSLSLWDAQCYVRFANYRSSDVIDFVHLNIVTRAAAEATSEPVFGLVVAKGTIKVIALRNRSFQTIYTNNTFVASGRGSICNSEDNGGRFYLVGTSPFKEALAPCKLSLWVSESSSPSHNLKDLVEARKFSEALQFAREQNLDEAAI